MKKTIRLGLQDITFLRAEWSFKINSRRRSVSTDTDLYL